MRPDWAKGFYRKGTALVGLERQEEGMEAFSRCLTLDPSFHSAKVSLTKVLHTFLQPVDASSLKANELQRSPIFNKFHLDDVVSDGQEESSRVEEVAAEEEKEDEKKDESSPVKHNLNTSRTLDRRKFSPVDRKYTKKRLPSQTDEQFQPITDGSSPHTENQSKRFKKCPLSMLESRVSGEKEQVAKPGPGYKIPLDIIEKADFECSLCLRLFYQPTTTPCGHTFCRGCLDRCLDYSQACPLCKQSLTEVSLSFGFTDETLLQSIPRFAEYGCMLEINQLEYLPDGRCVLGTIGGRRFKVLERGMRNGYNTAKVEFLKDTVAEGDAGSELRALNHAVYQQARTWFVNLPIYHQTRIVDHFGPMPQQASDPQSSFNGPHWHWWVLAILPLHPRVQLSILSKTILKERLKVLELSLTRMTNIPS
eukprot:XP_011671505.1 PREDICTED: LON peptidase N-terminal domain and RING finger protein 1 [Strongylocentrotus purpuratus]